MPCLAHDAWVSNESRSQQWPGRVLSRCQQTCRVDINIMTKYSVFTPKRTQELGYYELVLELLEATKCLEKVHFPAKNSIIKCSGFLRNSQLMIPESLGIGHRPGHHPQPIIRHRCEMSGKFVRWLWGHEVTGDHYMSHITGPHEPQIMSCWSHWHISILQIPPFRGFPQ